ncbi:MAG: hypothetical protein JWQ87_525 [Candidatus Sulfotelmatobacter sp.]|nr:hypothetical protein [Candidatus Sulfotelmatobacter sp.]
MPIVEHKTRSIYPPFVWAKNIQVDMGNEEFEISGVRLFVEDEASYAADALRAYRQAITRYGGAKRQGKNSPHVQFANADNLQKQTAFLRHYGPVVISSAREEERPVRSSGPFDFQLTEPVIVARQNLAELERERLVYRSALVLISELQRAKESDIATVRKCISTIVSNVSEWPSQWERERGLRVGGLGFAKDPQWKFSNENLRHLELWLWHSMRERSGDPLKDAFSMPNPVHDGHLVTSELVNAFAPHVYPWGDSPVEAPSWDLAGGIRPILYYMLRREYLSGGGISLCRNSDCRSIFEIERSRQEFCSEECSRLQRQREYWSARGKKLRKTRLGRRRRRRTDARKGRKEK